MSNEALTALHCQRCGATFDVPEVSEILKLELAEIARSGTIYEVVRRLTSITGITRAEAKGIALHITRMKGVCHRCYYPLPTFSHYECPKCKALNFDC